MKIARIEPILSYQSKIKLGCVRFIEDFGIKDSIVVLNLHQIFYTIKYRNIF